MGLDATRMEILLAGVLVGCHGASRSVDLTRAGAEIGSAVAEAVGEPRFSERIFLDALTATSGSGVERVLDDDPATGWMPEGDPNQEGILLRLESPRIVRTLRVTACPSSAEARVQTYLNGVAGPTFSLSAGREVLQELEDEQSRQGLTTISILFDQAADSDGDRPCIAEIGLRDEANRVLPLRPPRSVRGRVRASSTAEPTAVWWGSGLVDAHVDSAWAEGAQGLGEGERVLVTLDEPVEIIGFEVWNGDQRSPRHFEERGRVKRLRIEIDGSEPIVTELNDKLGVEVVNLPAPVNTSAFAVVMEENKAGSSSRFGETVALSELRLLDSHGSLRIRTNDAFDRQQATSLVIAGQPLEHVVDSEWSSVCGYPRRKLKIRSDQSFVRTDGNAMWDLPDEEGVSEVFEGHWFVSGARTPWSRLGLWGTRHRADVRWLAYGDEPNHAVERSVEGDLEVAAVEDLGANGFRAIVEDWGRRTQSDRVDCLTEELGAWPDVYDGLVANGAIVVRGSTIVDLMWKERG